MAKRIYDFGAHELISFDGRLPRCLPEFLQGLEQLAFCVLPERRLRRPVSWLRNEVVERHLPAVLIRAALAILFRRDVVERMCGRGRPPFTRRVTPFGPQSSEFSWRLPNEKTQTGRTAASGF